MKISGVYIIKNTINGNTYIGSSKDIHGRFYTHRYELRKQKHHCRYLQNAWDKYGESNFVFEILEECIPFKETLLEREQHYIDTLNPTYNHLPKAGSRLGSKASSETRTKMSASMKGKNRGPKSPEHRARLAEMARNMTDDTRAKMSAAKRGTGHSDETRQKMSEAHKGYEPTRASIEKMIRSKAEKRAQKTLEITESLKGKTLSKNDVRHTLRKLSDDDVRAIRSRPETAKELSAVYGVTETTINRIRRGLIYRDIF